MENKPILFEKKGLFCNRLVAKTFMKKEVINDEIVEKPIEYYQLEESIGGAVFPTLKISEEMYERMKAEGVEQKEIDITFIFKVKKEKYVVEIFDFRIVTKK